MEHSYEGVEQVKSENRPSLENMGEDAVEHNYHGFESL